VFSWCKELDAVIEAFSQQPHCPAITGTDDPVAAAASPSSSFVTRGDLTPLPPPKASLAPTETPSVVSPPPPPRGDSYCFVLDLSSQQRPPNVKDILLSMLSTTSKQSNETAEKMSWPCRRDISGLTSPNNDHHSSPGRRCVEPRREELYSRKGTPSSMES
jgi:hypothetical protein